MLLKEAKKDGYAAHQRIEDGTIRSQQIAAFEYIEHLSHATNTNTSKWNIVRKFGVGGEANGVQLIETDRLKINKIFFTEVEKGADSEEEPVLSPALAAEFKQMSSTFAERRKESLRSTIGSAMASAVDYHNSMENYLIQAASAYRELDMMNGGHDETKLPSEIEKILRKGFFKLVGTYNNQIWFATSPYQLWEKIPAAGVNYGLSMHPLAVKLDLSSMQIYVYRWENLAFNLNREGKIESFTTAFKRTTGCALNRSLPTTLSVRGYFHPHVNGSGKVCWGSALESMPKLMGTCELDQLFENLRIVLTQYNAGNPYIRLQDMFLSAPASERLGSFQGVGNATPENQPEDILDEDEEESDDF